MTETANKNIPSIDTLLTLTKDDMSAIDTLILENMQSEVPLIPQLAGYLISAGGKRLRPMLTIATAKMCGDDSNLAPLYGTCVEFIHTATLLHDDVVDESDLRRGKASANTVWGNQATVLVGDFLFSRAFQLMSNADNSPATSVLADASARLAEGEILQLLTTSNVNTTMDEYLDMIGAKTAVLFAAASKTGGVLANADAQKQQALYNFGEFLGVAFQMIDDALDYDGNASDTGKNIGDDFKEGKITLPLLHVIKNADVSEKEFLHRCIVEKKQTNDDMETMQGLISKYSAIEATYNQANIYGKKAQNALDIFPDSVYKSALCEAVDYAIKRAN